MPSDRRLGTKVGSAWDKDRIFGAKRDSGPYIGIVKNNADPIRSGRLQVFIPDFGGVESETSHWITVGYASPYLGAARKPYVVTKPSDSNTYTAVNHSYGMWFTPPDIGNQVLVTFVGGDTNFGYWFACIMPDLSHAAIPAMGGSMFLADSEDAALQAALTTPPYPTVEFNELNKELRQNLNNFLEIKKPVHEDQVKILLKQGLEDDKVRGVVSSSSQRESPSKVFGISTPGGAGGTPDKNTGAVPYRTGGHTFVMDDGDSKGVDELIRLRTAGGHQILMNDSEKILYIGNSSGSVWMEFTDDGKINMFSDSDFNLRVKGDINFHSDKSINMFAYKNIQQFAGTQIQQQAETITIKATNDLEAFGGKVGIASGSSLHMIAATDGSFGSSTELVYKSGLIYLNTKPVPDIPAIPDVTINTYQDAKSTMADPIFKYKPTGQMTSTVPSAPPTHEPWAGHPAPAKT